MVFGRPLLRCVKILLLGSYDERPYQGALHIPLIKASATVDCHAVCQRGLTRSVPNVLFQQHVAVLVGRFVHGSGDSWGIKRAAEQNQPLIGKWPMGMFLSAYSLTSLPES